MQYWAVAMGELGIVITCAGHDREGTVGEAVKVFDRLATASPSFRIVADLREMTGYETASRKAWQEVFRRHAKKIDALVLVGARSALIRMGAAAVGAFAGIPVKFVKDFDELARFGGDARR